MWNACKIVISQYLEVNESRKSIVVLILIGLSLMGLYKMYLGNDLPPITASAILTLSGYVFGINALNNVSNMYSSYMSNKVIGNISNNKIP